jgi:microcystin-dependent protein
MEAFVGLICLFPQNSSSPFVPRGEWMKCDGRILQIPQYQALYAVIGNEFGGNRAAQTFAIPNIPPLKPANGGDVDYYICFNGVFPSDNS